VDLWHQLSLLGPLRQSRLVDQLRLSLHSRPLGLLLQLGRFHPVGLLPLLHLLGLWPLLRLLHPLGQLHLLGRLFLL
jgi:hypothetical protein